MCEQPAHFNLPPSALTAEQRAIQTLNRDGDDRGLGMGMYTGERLRQSNPKKHEAIALQLGDALGVRTVARLTRSHHRTMAAVRKLEGACIDTLKQEQRRDCRTGAGMSVDPVLNDLTDDTSLSKLSHYHKALIRCILVNRDQLLLGQAPSRMDDHHHLAPTVDDYNARLRSGAIDAKVRETGQGGETAGQKESAAERPELPAHDPERDGELQELTQKATAAPSSLEPELQPSAAARPGELILNQRISDPNTGTKGDLSGPDTTSDTTAAADLWDADDLDAAGQAATERTVCGARARAQRGAGGPARSAPLGLPIRFAQRKFQVKGV